jgi:hypothetical protein
MTKFRRDGRRWVPSRVVGSPITHPVMVWFAPVSGQLARKEILRMSAGTTLLSAGCGRRQRADDRTRAAGDAVGAPKNQSLS